MSRIIDAPNWNDYAFGLEEDRKIKPGLLTAISMLETNGGHKDIIGRKSSAGAQGMFQFMPGTAKQYNVNVADPGDSARGAADYLSDLTKMYGGDHLKASAAYNWGQGNLNKAIKKAQAAGLEGNIADLVNGGYLPDETKNYVMKVDSHIAKAKPKVYSDGPGPAPAPTQGKTLAQAVQGGASDNAIASMYPEVGALVKQGVPLAEAVTRVGNDAHLGRAIEARQEASKNSVLKNLAIGAGKTASNWIDEAKIAGNQLIGNEAAAARGRQELNNQNALPEVGAVMDTTSGKIGAAAMEAAPNLAGGVIGGVGKTLLGTVGRQALAGGVTGAATGLLQPADNLADRGINALQRAALDAAVGGGAPGVLGGVGKGVSAGASRLFQGSKATREAAEQAAQSLTEAGLPVTAATISGKHAPVLKSAAGEQLMNTVNQKVNTTIAERAGVPNWTGAVDADLLQTAKANVAPQIDEIGKTVVKISPEQTAAIEAAKNLKTISRTDPQLKKLLEGVGPESTGGDIYALTQQLNKIAGYPTASQGIKNAAKELAEGLEKNLKNSLSDPNMYDMVKDRLKHIDAIEKMMPGAGEPISANRLVNVMKSSKFRDEFASGTAPYSDLAKNLGNITRPVAEIEKGAAESALRQKLTTGALAGLGVLGSPVTAVAGYGAKKLARYAYEKAATSTNKTLVKLLTGVGEPTQSKVMAAVGQAVPEVKTQLQQMPASQKETFVKTLSQQLQKDAQQTAGPKPPPPSGQGVVPRRPTDFDVKVQNQDLPKREFDGPILKETDTFKKMDGKATEYHYNIDLGDGEIGRVIMMSPNPKSVHQAGKEMFSLKDIRMDPEFQKQGIAERVLRELVMDVDQIASDTSGTISAAGKKMFEKYGKKQPDGSYIVNFDTLNNAGVKVQNQSMPVKGNPLVDKINKLQKDIDFSDVDMDSRMYEAYSNVKHPDHELAIKHYLVADLVKENMAKGNPLTAKVLDMKLEAALARYLKHEKNFNDVRAFREWEDDLQYGTPKSSDEALTSFRKYMADKLKKREWDDKKKEEIDLEVFKKRMNDLDKTGFSGEITNKM